MIRILTKNGVDNTNVDGARDHNFNAGRRSGIVQGALNQGNFFASNNNTIALDTCELRLCGHRIVLDKAEYRTFTNKPSVPVRYSFVARVVVDSDDNVSFEFVSQEATTQLVQDNLDITGSGTYELEIGKFTQLTDGNITDVVRTADLITGGADNDSEYIRIGTVTTNKISPELDADVDIENTINLDDNKPQTNFTFNLPTPSGTVVSLNGVEKTSINTDTTPNANSENLITSGGVHDYPAIAFAESERQKSKNLCGLIDFEQTINGVTIRLVSASQTVTLNGTATSTFDAMTTVRNMLPYVSNMQGEDLKVTAYYLSGTKSDSAIAFISTVDNDDVFGDRSAGILLPDNNLTSINFLPSKNSTYNTLMLYTPSGTSFTNYMFRIQIEKGQVTDWEYPHGPISHNKELDDVAVSNNAFDLSVANANSYQSVFDLLRVNKGVGNFYFAGNNFPSFLPPCPDDVWHGTGNIDQIVVKIDTNHFTKSLSMTLQGINQNTPAYKLDAYFDGTNWRNSGWYKPIAIELIYDIDTKNTIGETAYTSGIKFGASININVSGYSKINVYSRVYNTYNITEVVIDKTGWTGNSFMIFGEASAIKNVGILIYHEGQNITPAECFNFSDGTGLNNNDNAYVYRIEGLK